MSKNVAVFVDVANIFYAAKAAGVDIDYVTLLKASTAGRDFVRAYAYTGLDPENENQRQFHAFLGRSGYKVISKDIRKYGDGRIKANLDIELVVDMMRMAQHIDIAVVVSGDGDFAPAIRAVQQMGVRVEVVSFRGNTSSDLIEVADVFTDISQLARVEKGERSGRRVAREDDLSMTAVPEKETDNGVRRRRGEGRDPERPARAGRARRPRATVRRGRARPCPSTPRSSIAQRRQHHRAAWRAPVAGRVEELRGRREPEEYVELARGRRGRRRRERPSRAPRSRGRMAKRAAAAAAAVVAVGAAVGEARARPRSARPGEPSLAGSRGAGGRGHAQPDELIDADLIEDEYLEEEVADPARSTPPSARSGTARSGVAPVARRAPVPSTTRRLRRRAGDPGVPARRAPTAGSGRGGRDQRPGNRGAAGAGAAARRRVPGRRRPGALRPDRRARTPGGYGRRRRRPRRQPRGSPA